MASIPFTISPAPGIINDLIAVIYETSAPAAEVDRQTIPAPHDSPANVNFPGIPPAVYIVKIFETPDGTTLGTLRHDFWVDAALEKVLAYEPLTFQVGLGRGAPNYDPNDQDTSYINPDLDGQTYTVFKPGYGPLSWDADITPLAGGGFMFTNSQVFAQDEIYTILISNLVAQPANTASTAFPVDYLGPFGADLVFDSTHYNNMLEFINTTQEVITLSVDLATIPNGVKFGINTHRHAGPNTLLNVQILLTNGVCLLNGRAEGLVIVGKAEEAVFYNKNGELKIVSWSGDICNVGRKILDGGFSPVIANALPLTGYWIHKSRVPRFWYYYVNRLGGGQVWFGTDGVDPGANTNRYKWGIGATMIWIPDHKGIHYKNNFGGYADHEWEVDGLGPGQVRTFVFTGQGINKTQSHGGGVGPIASYGDGGFITIDSASGTNNNSVRIDPFEVISPYGENRVRSLAVSPYVII